MDTETDQYLSIVDMIHGFARKYTHLYDLDTDELFSEGNVEALRAIRCFDPDRGMLLSSWVYLCLSRFYNRLVRGPVNKRRVVRPTGNDLPVEHGEVLLPARNHFDLDSLLFEVSDEAADAILFALVKHKRHGKRDIIRSLRREFHWEKSVIQQVIQEIREALR